MNTQGNREIAEIIVDRLLDGGGITRNGHYGLSRTISVDVIESLLNGEEDHLSEYDRLTWLGWESVSQYGQASEEDIELWKLALDEANHWNIKAMFDEEEIESISFYVNQSAIRLEDEKTYKIRRRKASSYIQKKEVRKKVFDKCNHKCVRCKSIKNLSIDHIISVKNNGSNKINNLQVLCRKCNSSKGGK